VKFCQFVANLYPRMFVSFGRFILVFIKMHLIFYKYLSFSSFQILSFIKSNCCDFTAND